MSAYLHGQAAPDTRPVYVTTTYYGHGKRGPVVKVTPTRITLRIRVGRDSQRYERTLSKPIEDVWCDYQTLDLLTAQLTAFDSFGALLDTVPTYRPTLRNTGLHRLLANHYDAAQQRRGDTRRAFRMSK